MGKKMIEVKRLTEENIDDVPDITLTHKYNPKTKELRFIVRKTEGCMTRRNSCSTEHPAFEYGMED